MALDAKVRASLEANLCCRARGLARLARRGRLRQSTASRARSPPARWRRWAKRCAPAFFAEALRKLGGAHFHGTLALRVGPRGRRAGRGHHHHRRLARPCGELPVARGKRSRRRARGRPHGRELVGCATLWEDDPPRRRGAGAEPAARRGAGRALGGVRACCAPHARRRRRATSLVGGARATSLRAVGWATERPAKPPARRRFRWRGCGPGAATRRSRRCPGRLVVDDATGALLKADSDRDVPGQGGRRGP